MMNRVVSYSSGHPMSQQPGAIEALFAPTVPAKYFEGKQVTVSLLFENCSNLANCLSYQLK
jgi:hypothetical protein